MIEFFREPPILDPEPGLFPHLQGKEQDVPPGAYSLLDGTDETTHIREGEIDITADELYTLPNLFPGVQGVEALGWYNGPNGIQPIVSFQYHKVGPDGLLEKGKRVMIVTGTGFGVHHGHKGDTDEQDQDPTWYLVGPQIGTIDEAGQIMGMPEGDADIAAKHFATDCMVDGPLGDKPVLANPAVVSEEAAALRDEIDAKAHENVAAERHGAVVLNTERPTDQVNRLLTGIDSASVIVTSFADDRYELVGDLPDSTIVVIRARLTHLLGAEPGEFDGCFIGELHQGTRHPYLLLPAHRVRAHSGNPPSWRYVSGQPS